MPTAQSPWEFLGKQQQRLVLLASVLALGVGVVNSFLDKADPPVISLLMFSVLLVGMCLWMIVARTAPLDAGAKAPRARKRQYSLVQMLCAWAASALVLVIAWSFIYREHLSYSQLAHRMLGGPRILVSDVVAWHILRYPTATGEKKESTTVAGELDSLLSGLPYRVVVISREDLADFTPNEDDGFVLEGVADKLEIVLKAHMVITDARAERLIDQLRTDVEIEQPDQLTLILPAKRFLRNQFLFSGFTVEAPLARETPEEDRTRVARLIMRYALATIFYYDGEPDAARLFREILDVGKLLGSIESEDLAQIYKATSFYFAKDQHSGDEALEALHLAESLASSDPEIGVMKTYLLLVSGRPAEAGEQLMQLTASPDDPALFYELQGEYFFAIGQFKKAIAAYETALESEPDDYYRARLHLAVSLAYGVSRHAEPDVRSAEMIKHLEDAIQLASDVAVYHILQGFAWALVGNAEMSRKALERAHSLVETREDEELLTYWIGKSLFELEQFPEAIEELAKVLGDPAESESADLLFMFGKNLVIVAGREGDAERYLARSIQLDPGRAEAHRYMGLAVTKRMMNTSASEARRQLAEQARSYFLRSIRLGDERAATHALLADLYEVSGDSINAKKHRRRLCELDPDAIECLLQRGQEFVEAGDFSAAHDAFAAVHQANPENFDFLLMEGIIWQKAERNAEAEEAYAKALQLDDNSYIGHDNLGFVLFDLERFDEALRHFKRALEIRPNGADALGGKGIALEAMGDHAAALGAYRLAVEQNRGFLDPKTLEVDFIWSEKARETAQPLIEEVRATEHEEDVINFPVSKP